MQRDFFPTIHNIVIESIKLINDMGRERSILLLTHIDADGLSSAAIIARLLNNLDKPFVIKPINQIRRDVLEDINNNTQPDDLIILDMGSGDLDTIQDVFKDVRRILIIDHHIPKNNISKNLEKTNFIFFNPWLLGYNGSKDISTSGLSFLLSYPYIGKIENMKKSVINAIVGATGDNQDNGSRGEFTGLNRQIVESGKKIGLVEELIDISIYRRESKPLYKALAEAYNLDIPGITGNEESSLNFLKSIGIINSEKDIEKTLVDLTTEEKIKLTDEIISRLVFSYSDKYSIEEIKNMVMTTIYIFPKEKRGPTRNNKEFAGLLNACGKLGYPELGLAIALGDRKNHYNKGLELLNSYQEIISDLLRKAMDNLEIENKIILVNGQEWLDENLTSTISSMISYSKKIENDGVVVVIGKSTNDFLKISFRITPNLRGKINLKDIIKKATEKIQYSSGGGHDVAAGAYVPANKIDEFLKIIKNEISKII